MSQPPSASSSSAPSSAAARVAVVTGAASGIGRALAIQLAAEGCELALADINEEGLKETQAMLRWPDSLAADAKAAAAAGAVAPSSPASSASSPTSVQSSRVLLQKLDVSRRADVLSFADRVLERWGAPHLVINNAGVAVSQHVDKLKFEDIDWIMGINFGGVVSGTKAFLPAMLAANRGVIVNVSSIFGVIAVPSQAAYNASKMAVRGWTEALEWELYQRDTQVRCLLVMPGGVATNIARSARFFVDPEGGADLATAMNRFDSVARTTPAAAAAAILQAIHRGDSRLLIGPDAKALFWLQRCLPRHYFHVLNAFVATTKIVQPRIQSVLRWWRGEKAAAVIEKKGQ